MKRFHFQARDPQDVSGQPFHALGELPGCSQPAAATPGKAYW